MSILSWQCERLRDRANELRMLASGMDAPYIVPETKKTMALAMQSAASEMREAADTIESLRDRLQTTTETCENVYPGKPIDRHLMFQCSACGHVQTNGTYSPEWWNAEHTDDECAAYDGEPIRFCPHCGRKAVDA